MSQGKKLSDVLSSEELRTFQQKSNLHATITLLWNWLVIFTAFAMVVVWPNPLTVIVGILLLAGRHQGLGVIMHDCAHHAFFKNKSMDDFVGQWLCGVPMNADMYAYRAYHLNHHKHAGTPEDPDIGFVRKYPVTRASIKRKFIRDFTGQTAFRDQLMRLKAFKLSKQWPWLVFHCSLLALLIWVGAGWAYLMWWVAELFIYPAIARLRQIGEHGVAENRSEQNARLNTGTTILPWWQKLLIAPNNVGYHVEHHMLASIPPYNLRRLHELLKERGYFDGYDCIAYGYGQVLRRAVQAS
ncbi:MAG: fatty acid desaturase family protein [Pseudomonadota bacterium]